MKKIICVFLIFGALLVKSQDLVDNINPLMGTASTQDFSHGNTYPAIATPWAMNFWSPQTGNNGSGWMYSYYDKQIRGFRQTHQPSPWINDYGTFSIMPVADIKEGIDYKNRGANFKHSDEIAKPYYYSVKFDNGIFTELSSTERSGIFRIKFPEDKKKYIILDAYSGGNGVNIDVERRRITGYTKYNNGGVPTNFSNYFIVEFDKPIKYFGTSTNGKFTGGKLNAENKNVLAVVEFDISTGDSLTIRASSSFVSPEQANVNFDREIKGQSFDKIMNKSKDKWNNMLGRIKVEGGKDEDMRTFYSCLYRVLLFPRKFYEYNADNKPVYYSPYDGKVHNGYMFTDNGFWDTFRAVHPLFTIVYPELSEKITQSLINAYKESGFLPEWASPGHRNCMIGNNSVSVLVDAWMKGIRGVDENEALEAMINQCNNQHFEASVGRNGFEEYNKLGYVPYPDYSEATAKTLEYSYADWCVYQFAKSIGNTDIAEKYKGRAMNYRNVFDKNLGFVRARSKTGKWIEPFDPTEWGGGFTEGSSWHWTWSVMHDVEGLSNLFGGYNKMSLKMDSIFTAPPVYNVGTYGYVIHEMAEMAAINMGQYAHGNQPIQHAIYLYDYIAQPWKTQYHARNIMNKLYNSGAKGYCGDEDNGQTSAWYIFSAMGLYPVCPGVPEYALGSPLFKRISLQVGDNKFVIDAPNNNRERIYIRNARLNKNKFNNNFIRHSDIVNGGKLKLKMSDKPNKKRGIGKVNAPYSLSD